jgi:hypothetical protein
MRPSGEERVFLAEEEEDVSKVVIPTGNGEGSPFAR